MKASLILYLTLYNYVEWDPTSVLLFKLRAVVADNRCALVWPSVLSKLQQTSVHELWRERLGESKKKGPTGTKDWDKVIGVRERERERERERGGGE